MDAEKLTKLSKRVAYWGEPRKLETVVFVHGLKGDYRKTWADFPKLLTSDPEMPEIDILLWGYCTGALRPLVHDTPTLGKHLVSALKVHTPVERGIFLVGHSMGGLVVLESIVGEMCERRAEIHPTNSIIQVSLFASPVSGVTASTVVTNTFGKLTGIRKFFNKQIRSLAKGESCELLLNKVTEKVYRPTIEDTSAKKIPIRMIMATNDGAVSKSDRDSFKARFSEISPLEFDYGHSAVKEPESRHDERYKALANDIKDSLGERFADLCLKAINGTQKEKDDAAIDIEAQYGMLLMEHFVRAGGKPRQNWTLYTDYLDVVITNAATRRRTASDTAVRATIALRRAGKLPYA